MGYVSGVPIGISSVYALCQATGEALSPVTGALLATLPPVPLVRSGRDALAPRWSTLWLWMVRSARTTVFVPSPSRGGRVVRDLTGADYHGVVTGDRCASSNGLDPASLTPMRWAHLAVTVHGVMAG